MSFFDSLHRVAQELQQSGAGRFLWPALFVLSLALGVRHVWRHLQRGRVTIAGNIVGTRDGLDYSGASLFRSSWRTQRKPSLSPFYGRPVFLRALPFPAVVLLAYGWLYHPWIMMGLTLLTCAWIGRRTVRAVANHRHRKVLVRPAAKALAPILQEPTERILQGIVWPRGYQNEAAEIVIPLPDEVRPIQETDVARVISERTASEWHHTRSQYAPYTLTFRHKPAPPTMVDMADVAHMMITPGKVWSPFLGLGSERNAVRLNFDGDVVHLGVSAGTGAGKTTLVRILATQFYINSGGTAKQIFIDVKGDDEGMQDIPGMVVLNDIGSLRTLDGIYKMWDAIEWVCNEIDQRRMGNRGPKETWPPIVLWCDEQNMFGDFSKEAWKMIKEKSDPDTPPVYRAKRMIAFMGRSFKVRMIDVYQVMSAAAMGGGNAQAGAEYRRQFGNKLLARFDNSMWDNLVGTRPRGQSSTIPGRWLWVDNSGSARAVQLPYFKPEHTAELSRMAEIAAEIPGARTALPEASPEPVPSWGTGTHHEIPDAFGGQGDRGQARAAQGSWSAPQAPQERDQVVIPFRPRAVPNPVPEDDQEDVPERLTLKNACLLGYLPISYDTAKKRVQRTRERGDWFPEGIKEGREGERFLVTDLVKWHQQYEARKAQ